jgi:hypothetical protein
MIVNRTEKAMFQIIEISTGKRQIVTCSRKIALRYFQAMWARNRPAVLVASAGSFQ